MFLRKSHGSRLNVFAPINDLSTLSKTGGDNRALLAGQRNDVAIAGGQILGDEYSDHVVKVNSDDGPFPSTKQLIIYYLEPEWDHSAGRVRRQCPSYTVHSDIRRATSTLLKSDQWLSRSAHVSDGVRGAINFRNIPGSSIYALGQPTLEAIDEVVRRVHEAHPDASKIMWITLREEPIVYVNGAPYCLRRERFSLRNMKGKYIHSLSSAEP